MTETDGMIFLPAVEANTFGGTWTKTRTAAGDYNMLKTAGADTSQTVFCLNKIFSKIGTDPLAAIGLDSQEGGSASNPAASRIRGVRITAIDVVWKNTTADITSGTVDLHQTTYASLVAPAVVSTVGGTLTGASLTITANAAPRLETVSLGTPYVLSNNLVDVSDWCEIAWVAAATSVLTVYGIFVKFDYNFL
jgi:hypothetical protein